MQVMFVEAHANVDLIPAIRKNLAQIKRFKRVGLFTTVQHIHKIAAVKDFLEKQDIKILLSNSKKGTSCQGPRATYCGQLLGCDSTPARSMNVDAYLYIGTGEFHPIAISLETDRPVFKLNPHSKKIELIAEAVKRKWLAKQAARISKLKDAKKIGILVSSKPGQYKPKLAERLQKKFKNSYVFISDMITPQALMDFPDIDVWINTACPRLVEDSWPKPLVNADEVL